jgi:hypothetical protein
MKLYTILAVFIGCMVCTELGFAQTKQEFAMHLIRDADYFRAISELKEIRFFSKDLQTKNVCTYYIGYSYFRSAKYQLAIDELSNIVSSNDSNVSTEIKNKSVILNSLCYEGLKLLTYSEYELNRIANPYDTLFSYKMTKVLLLAEQKKYAECRSLVNRFAEQDKDIRHTTMYDTVLHFINRAENMPYTSPLLAGCLSAIIPGSGQIYSKHYFDGLQAFAFVSAFAYSTYATYRYEQLSGSGHLGSSILLLLTTTFHLSNIIGAVNTAGYRNERGIDLLMLDFRNQVLSVNLHLNF